VLRPFIRDLKVRIGAVQAAKRIRISRTALNNYITQGTATQPRVRAKLASCYLRAKRAEAEKEAPKAARRVAERRPAFPEGGVEERIRGVLPADPKEAVRALRKLFAPVRHHPEEAPGFAAALEALLIELAKRRPPER
jgi:hypothetical protein